MEIVSFDIQGTSYVTKLDENGQVVLNEKGKPVKEVRYETFLRLAQLLAGNNPIVINTTALGGSKTLNSFLNEFTSFYMKEKGNLANPELFRYKLNQLCYMSCFRGGEVSKLVMDENGVIGREVLRERTLNGKEIKQMHEILQVEAPGILAPVVRGIHGTEKIKPIKAEMLEDDYVGNCGIFILNTENDSPEQIVEKQNKVVGLIDKSTNMELAVAPEPDSIIVCPKGNTKELGLQIARECIEKDFPDKKIEKVVHIGDDVKEDAIESDAAETLFVTKDKNMNEYLADLKKERDKNPSGPELGM